jgi:hypothetical protein
MVCEESKTMMEDKLGGSNNFKFPENKTSEEYLLWVIQKGLPETTINEWKEDDFRERKITKGDTMNIFFIYISDDRDDPGSIGEIISTSSGIHLYILCVSLL